jgi:predicted PurR-regulated permease PerM
VTTLTRDRVGWWVYVLALAGVALFVGHSLVGLLVLGLFGYYATRPICQQISEFTDSERVAAVLTVLTVLVPVFLVVFYAGYRILQQLRPRLDEGVVRTLTSQFTRFGGAAGRGVDAGSPQQGSSVLDQLAALSPGVGLDQVVGALSATFGGLLLVGLAITLAYALLTYDDALAEIFATLVGGRDATAYTYVLAVDDDLESIFFGNLLFAVVMSVVATVTYAATNLVAPPGIQVPMVFTLGFLTGVASLIPVVVGKVAYVPLTGYLAYQASTTGSGEFVFVGVVLVVYFLVLDVIPQSFLQPYVSGQQVNSMLLLFAYILGPILFGWYGFFLLPIIFVLMLEAVRIVLPDLLRGDPLVPDVSVGEDEGADPQGVTGEVSPADDVANDSSPADEVTDDAPPAEDTTQRTDAAESPSE